MASALQGSLLVRYGHPAVADAYTRTREEAEQHNGIIEAQQDEIDAEERTEPGSGYGH